MFWFNEAVSNYTALLSGKSWLAPDGDLSRPNRFSSPIRSNPA